MSNANETVLYEIFEKARAGSDKPVGILRGIKAVLATQGTIANDAVLGADERAAFERFVECADDGEGYDVPKPMMQRLAQIGVVRRTHANYYETTEIGLSILAQPSAQPSDTPVPTHKCGTCGFLGVEDEVIGCTRCGFDDMSPIAAPQVAQPSAEETRDWNAINKAALEYVKEYEYDDGCVRQTPTKEELVLIDDCVASLLNDDDFRALFPLQTITCQIYGHEVQGCIECNHGLTDLPTTPPTVDQDGVTS